MGSFGDDRAAAVGILALRWLVREIIHPKLKSSGFSLPFAAFNLSSPTCEADRFQTTIVSMMIVGGVVLCLDRGRAIGIGHTR